MNKKLVGILMILIVAVTVVVIVYKKNDNNDDNGNNNIIGGVRMPNIECKITEVQEDNYLIVEVIREDVGFSKGDKVLVKYNTGTKYMADSGEFIEEKLALNDVVSIQYRDNEIKNKDGYIYLEVENVSIYE